MGGRGRQAYCVEHGRGDVEKADLRGLAPRGDAWAADHEGNSDDLLVEVAKVLVAAMLAEALQSEVRITRVCSEGRGRERWSRTRPTSASVYRISPS